MGVPDGVQEIVAGLDLARSGDEHGEQLELRGGEGDFLAVYVNLVGFEVYLETFAFPQLGRIGFGRAGSTQDRLDAQHEFSGENGLTT